MSLMPIIIPNSGYSASAVSFNGSTYLTRGGSLTGSAAGKKGIISYWYQRPTSIVATESIIGNSNQFFDVLPVPDDNGVRVRGFNSGGGSILAIDPTGTYSFGHWHNIISSWDLSIGATSLYIDNVNVRSGSPTAANQNIAYNQSNWSIGAETGGSAKFTGYLADLYLNTTEYLDLSNSANRAKFINQSTLKPVNLGPTGAFPTGTSPICFFSGNASSFNVNLGTGGNFSVAAGALANAPSSPSD